MIGDRDERHDVLIQFYAVIGSPISREREFWTKTINPSGRSPQRLRWAPEDRQRGLICLQPFHPHDFL